MAEKENIINKLLSLAWTKKGGRLFRITPGKLWAGKVIGHYVTKDKSRGIALKNARPIEMFKKGMPDNLGFEPIEITSDMIGIKLPVFCVIEVKTIAYPKLTTIQKEKLNYLQGVGVRCYVAREIDDGYELEEW